VLFLLFVVVASAVGIGVVLLRNRRPTSMEASISDFERSLRALAPESSRDADSAHAGPGLDEVDDETGTADAG
jgi:hypothetical protein